ncbi:MAG: single-stranded-DNA-specific exonuclease RecJ [Spirochaetaceae bacterium]|nr:single-stranded-DNA-specific exonuclease RecJ [Spirochaetaceae bacterium]
MATWNKKNIAKELVMSLHTKYGTDLLTSSILARRDIITGSEVQYFLEQDKRFLHCPFLFDTMEDACDRILDAKEEGEKVLIFGDRDVDGITSTTLLYQYLKSIGIDVQYKIPSGDDDFGLSIDAIDNFAANYGTLIITVDNGICCKKEVDHAADLGIDVIVVDHHEPNDENYPELAIVIDPKVEDCGYPFPHISGCAVVYKLITALRFALNPLYKQEICLLNVHPINDAYVIECLKIENMIIKDKLSETFVPGVMPLHQTKLVDFLKGQQIFVWDENLQKKMLVKIFGQNVEINMLDVRPEIATIIPSMAELSLLRLKSFSKIAKYQESPSSEIEAFYNIFITFIQMKISENKNPKIEEEELQLVALAALADIMPLQNENRILVRQGIASMNKGRYRPGLYELIQKQNMLGKKISSTDLSWNIVPLLNATGRLGEPETALQLLLEENPQTREKIADRILALNIERKKLGAEAQIVADSQVRENLPRFSNKIAYVKSEKINRGVTGIVAGKLSSMLKLPSIVIGQIDGDLFRASLRSISGIDLQNILDYCNSKIQGGLFEKYGGHSEAAGFSIKKENLPILEKALEEYASYLEIPENAKTEISIDAELPFEYMSPELLNLVDSFEPFGQGNPNLKFLVKNAKIISADVMGKTEVQHLRLTIDCGKYKWPSIYWKAAERLNRDFSVGDKVNIVFEATRNLYNGNETPQMNIVEMEKV